MAYQKQVMVFGALMVVFAVTVGCTGDGGPAEEPTVNVTGKITKGGQPLHLDPKMAAAKAARVEVRFIRLDGKDANFSATAFAEPDGTFAVTGGLPAGKYRVSVKHFDGGMNDELKGKFGEQNSPIERDVAGDTVIDVELDDEG